VKGIQKSKGGGSKGKAPRGEAPTIKARAAGKGLKARSSGKGKAKAGNQAKAAKPARTTGPGEPRKPEARGGLQVRSGRKHPLAPLGPLLPVEARPEDPRIKRLAIAAWNAALDKKCLEPVLLDVRALASYADYILIVSGRSDRQVQAIADGIDLALRDEGKRALSTEGTRDGQWTLIDFGDLIAHVFYHPVREFYDLEGLWSDAPRVPLEVPPEARAHLEDAYAPVKTTPSVARR
jgi:ribosome-associated protein